MVKIRLARVGCKKSPFYRVVVTEVTVPRNGRFIENLAFYDPMKDPQVIQLKEDRVLHWLTQGAVPTDTARSLLRKQGLLKRWREMGASEPAGAEESAEAPAEA